MDSSADDTRQSVAVQETKTANPMVKVFRNRNFQLLFLGQGMSLIGDQFYLIALPWLVLMLTGDAAQLGLVLALAGVPRVALMLVGGALSDRFSQRSVMLASDVLRLFMTALLAVIVFSGSVQMWMIYLFAIAFGAISGVFQPAAQSMVPRIVGKDELMAGNMIEQITVQLSVFVGPLLAGGLIAWFAGSASPSLDGIGLAFTVDSFTFLASVATLLAIRLDAAPAAEHKSILASIGEGVSFLTSSRRLLLMFGTMTVINFLFQGPVLVGVPVMARDRLPEGAAAYGLIMAAFALGTLLGAIATGAIRVRPANLGLVAAVCIGIFGVATAMLGAIGATWEGMAILFVAGLLNGYIGVVLVTLLQKSTPADMLGRVMSLVIVAGAGLVPVAEALSGFALKVSFEGVFAGCGLLILLVAIWAALSKDMREIGLELETAKIRQN